MRSVLAAMVLELEIERGVELENCLGDDRSCLSPERPSLNRCCVVFIVAFLAVTCLAI